MAGWDKIQQREFLKNIHFVFHSSTPVTKRERERRGEEDTK